MVFYTEGKVVVVVVRSLGKRGVFNVLHFLHPRSQLAVLDTVAEVDDQAWTCGW